MVRKRSKGGNSSGATASDVGDAEKRTDARRPKREERGVFSIVVVDDMVEKEKVSTRGDATLGHGDRIVRGEIMGDGGLTCEYEVSKE